MGDVIAFMSGKGGVGKTTAAANIGASLEKLGKSVLMFDADVCLPNLDTVFGIKDSTVWDINDVYKERCSLDDAAIEHPLHKNLFTVNAPSVMPDNPLEITGFIAQTAIANRNSYDFILIDCPSGLGSEQTTFMRKAIKLVIIATPDRTSLTDASKTASLAYEKGSSEVYLAVNRIEPQLIKKGKAPDIDEMIDTAGARLIGLIPEDQRIRAFSFGGVLVCDLRRSHAKKAFENIAKRLTGRETELYEFWKQTGR